MDDPNTTVTLGDLAEKVTQRVRSGEYESATEVIRAGLEALEREERDFETMLKAKVQEAIADTRPSIPMEEVFAKLRARLDERDAAPR